MNAPSAAQAGSSSSVRSDGVPFITRWTGEDDAPSPVVERRDGRGIRYADERAYDRVDGILWARVPSQPGRGKPEFGVVHSLRQRLAMNGLLCQVCGQSADRNADGVLWLVDAERDDLRPGDERTSHPPVCLPCARWSVHACPHLRRAWVAVRVRSFALCGVNGALYAPGRPAPVVLRAGLLDFGDPFLPWVRASQLIMALQDFTVTDL